MPDRPARPFCGNDPRAQLTDGDRQAVTDFRAYLAARAERRRQYGDVLRRWGLLDEVNDPQATEEFAVTDLLALVGAELKQTAAAAQHPGPPCTCRQTVHTQHHTTPVPGCPWCASAAPTTHTRKDPTQ